MSEFNENNHKLLYYDNYYSSIPTAFYLAKSGVYTVSTLTRNRIPGIPFEHPKITDKEQQVFYEEFVTQINGMPFTINT